MISFQFTINNSFKTYTTHPITVPKNQVDYTCLEKELLHKGDLTIVFPKGERVRGHMYHGKAGYGPYYQIRMYTEDSVPAYLKEGDKVLVVPVRDESKIYVILEYRT